MQFRQDQAGTATILQEDRFRDLQFQAPRLQSRAHQGRDNRARQPVAFDQRGRDIDGDTDMVVPLHRVPARLFESPGGDRLDQRTAFRDRDELCRGYPSHHWMIPAHQRFADRYLASHRVEDRLIMQQQFAVRHRLAQAHFQFIGAVLPLFHGPSEMSMAIPPGVLRLVKRHVGMLEQFVAVSSILRSHRDAHGGGYALAVATDIEVMTEFRHHIIDDLLRRFPVRTGADEDEFVAAEARHMTAPVNGIG